MTNVVLSVEGTKHHINTVSNFFAKKRIALKVLEVEQFKFILNANDSRTFEMETDRKLGLLAIYSSLPVRIEMVSIFTNEGTLTTQTSYLFSTGIAILSDDLRSIAIENMGTEIVDVEVSTAIKEN